jgi:NAD(P)H dehydrogenase (quinone)
MQGKTVMAKVLVLFYSSWGHVEALAGAVADGARAAGATVDVKHVPELVPAEIANKLHYTKSPAPIATPDELAQYDAIVFGTPTRFGNMAAQMRNFLDQTGGLWAKGALIGKVGSAFCSTASQHGGQETTLTSIHTTLFHHGMIVVGLPYSHPELTDMTEVLGGTPYGATTLAGSDGSRKPHAKELHLAREQGKRVAEVAAKLSR